MPVDASNSPQQPLTIDVLEDFLKNNPIRQGWSWNEEGEKILFTQQNIARRQIRCFIECAADLSVKVNNKISKYFMQSPTNILCSKQVLLSDGKILQSMNARITSIFDIFENFDKIDQMKLSDGTGIDRKG